MLDRLLAQRVHSLGEHKHPHNGTTPGAHLCYSATLQSIQAVAQAQANQAFENAFGCLIACSWS